MRPSPYRDPLDGMSRAERRSWRVAERRVRAEHEHEQMAALRYMAATGVGVTGLSTPDHEDLPGALGTPVEMIIDGRRLRAGRVHRRTLAALRDGLSTIAAVPLTAVERYGSYWVLTFRLATEQLVVLVDHLTLLPDWGGPGGRAVPTGPLVRLAG